MKIKLFLSILMALNLIGSLKAMQPQPGTVINPMHQTGQFTVSGINSVGNNTSGLVPLINYIGQTSSSIAEPVLISFVAEQAPWWALTIGTGYLLICQCDISNPTFISSCIAGVGFATGSQATGLIKKIAPHKYTALATATLAASCIGISSAVQINLVQDVFFAAAKSMGLETIIELSKHLLAAKKSTAYPRSETAHASNQIMDTHLPTLFAELVLYYNPTELLRILLYEQAYRLASKGYQTAYDLCIQLKPNYTFLDHRRLACAII